MKLGKYDDKNAFLSIYAGTGGKDAEDWVNILCRMYQRYLREGFKTKKFKKPWARRNKINNIRGWGRGAYGLLKGENGVHRLVRISPFSAKSLRHTSLP